MCIRDRDEDVTEVARGDGERDFFILRFGCLQPSIEVVDDLSRNARPVNGIHGTDVVFGLSLIHI